MALIVIELALYCFVVFVRAMLRDAKERKVMAMYSDMLVHYVKTGRFDRE